MDKGLRNVLKTVVVAGQRFIKAGNAICDLEFGENIRKAAGEATDMMVEAGVVDRDKRDTVVDALVFDKSAALDGLERFSKARIADSLSLGTPEGIGKKAEEDMTADEIWESMWS